MYTWTYIYFNLLLDWLMPSLHLASSHISSQAQEENQSGKDW
jgi:hypothetical protein